MNNMKKVISFALMAMILNGCSKYEEPLNVISNVNDPIQILTKEYNINKQGLTVESAISGIDTSTIYFNGRINGKLWVGAYEKASKKQLLDFTENVKLDTVVNYSLGNGQYDSFGVQKFALFYPYEYNNSFCFLLLGYGGQERKGTSDDLYFIQGNTVKKYRTISPYQNCYNQIIPWYQGIAVEMSDIIYSGDICYNMQGDSLFTTKYDYHIRLGSYSPISYEECIDFFHSSYLNGYFFQRINLKTGETIWEIRNKDGSGPFNYLPEKTRLDNYTITKSNNEWTYTVNYTLYNGQKGIAMIVLDIKSGQFEIK